MSSAVEFRCNICGKTTACESERFTREGESCDKCGSSVRTRSLLRTLALELFQVDLTLPDFPVLKSLRGLGISDKAHYSEKLENKFDYRNTFHDRAPQFDLMSLPSADAGQYDFVIASDVLEHVPAPVETAFQNAYKLLKPGGVAILSVPYGIENVGTVERFPPLSAFSLTTLGGQAVLINRSAEGRISIFENLVFHFSTAPSLEMREFSEQGLKELLANAGFEEIHWHGDEYPAYGIYWNEPWSLPFAIRKGPPSFGAETIRELMGELGRAAKRDAQFDHFNRRRWTRLGRNLGALK